MVCDDCNSRVISDLETGFKQDTREGVFAQQLRVNNSKSVWIRGKNLQMKTIKGKKINTGSSFHSASHKVELHSHFNLILFKLN